MGKKAKLGKFRKDKFYKLAKETGFRSRAAFKLIQLNRKFGFLQQSQVCVDLCAAPGGWMQVAKQNMPVSSIVIGVDLYPIRPIPGCISLVEDITTEKCKTALQRELKTWKADVVLHDGAPNVGKNWLFDAYQQICLTLNALKLSTTLLRSGGYFVTKVFRSKDYNALLWVLKQLFKKVHATKPSASRKESAEIFIVCQGYLAPDKIDPKILDPKYVFEELDLENKKQASLLHPDKQKRIKADGYTEKDILMRNELSAIDFIQNTNGLAALNGVSCIKIEHDSIRNHPKTTPEILECCKDIKVLGKKDIKELLKWWKTVREDLFKSEESKDSNEIESEEKPRELTTDEIEDVELEELERQAVETAEQEKQDLKRKKKKAQKLRTKLNEKMNLKMVIKGDEGPREEYDDMFDLRNINTMEELDAIQDVAPDMEIENEEFVENFLPKYKRYEKESQHLDDDGFVKNGEVSDEDAVSSDSESNYDAEGLGLSDTEEGEKKKTSSEKKSKKQEKHPLIQPCDYRDKDTKRKQRVQLWFEKENLQNVTSDNDEDYDLDRLADEYKNKGVKILGENNDTSTVNSAILPLGKRAKRKAKYAAEKESSTDDSSDSDEEEYNATDKMNGDNNKTNSTVGSKTKKVRLNEYELALGTMMVNSRKTKRDLIDSAWNRYTFNDEGLPDWFVKDEEEHMRKHIPVPAELTEEYENKVKELNVRPIKKVVEAKARKKKRALKRLAKAKKKAEQILESTDASSNEKIRQIKKLYKKAEDKKKDISYVVAKKHLSGKRVRRPPGVKGRFKVVDPRMKKDKRAQSAKQKKGKGKK